VTAIPIPIPIPDKTNDGQAFVRRAVFCRWNTPVYCVAPLACTHETQSHLRGPGVSNAFWQSRCRHVWWGV